MSRRSKDKGVLKTVNAKEEALVRTQLKIMDIGPPLIDLYSCLANMEDAVLIGVCRSVQAALKQWGCAFTHISRKRRESVVNLTDSRVDYLLKPDDYISSGKEARDHLFTGRFLEQMLIEANQDETLARRDKAVAASDRRNPVRSTRRDLAHPPYSLRQSPYGVRQPSDRGARARVRRGFGDSRGGRGRGNPNPKRYELSHTFIHGLVTPSIDIKVGARLSSFANHWLAVTDDPWVLETVAGGLKINFISKPSQRSSPCDVSMSNEMHAVCQAEVGSL